MAYAEAQTLQQKTAGIAGTALAHVAIGGLIVVGLTVTGNLPEVYTGPMPTRDWKDIPPPPPPPEKPPETKPDAPQTPKDVFVPEPPVSISDNQPFTRTIPDLPPPGPVEPFIPSPRPDSGPGLAAIQPVAAVPRNDPGAWITDSDYKSRWVREELAGRASFTLGIGANGKVESCTITRSTGHSALDQATCQLITKRAKFKPAKTSGGTATTGTYSSAIRWELPD